MKDTIPFEETVSTATDDPSTDGSGITTETSIPATPALIATLEALKAPHPNAQYTLLPLKQGEKTLYFSVTKNYLTQEITLSISENIPLSAPFTGKGEGTVMIIGSAWDILKDIRLKN